MPSKRSVGQRACAKSSSDVAPCNASRSARDGSATAWPCLGRWGRKAHLNASLRQGLAALGEAGVGRLGSSGLAGSRASLAEALLRERCGLRSRSRVEALLGAGCLSAKARYVTRGSMSWAAAKVRASTRQDLCWPVTWRMGSGNSTLAKIGWQRGPKAHGSEVACGVTGSPCRTMPRTKLSPGDAAAWAHGQVSCSNRRISGFDFPLPACTKYHPGSILQHRFSYGFTPRTFASATRAPSIA